MGFDEERQTGIVHQVEHVFQNLRDLGGRFERADDLYVEIFGAHAMGEFDGGEEIVGLGGKEGQSEGQATVAKHCGEIVGFGFGGAQSVESAKSGGGDSIEPFGDGPFGTVPRLIQHRPERFAATAAAADSSYHH